MYNIKMKKATILLIQLMVMIEKAYELNLEKGDIPCDSYRLLVY